MIKIYVYKGLSTNKQTYSTFHPMVIKGLLFFIHFNQRRRAINAGVANPFTVKCVAVFKVKLKASTLNLPNYKLPIQKFTR